MADSANEKGAGKKSGRVRKRREAEEKKEEPLERREGGGKGKWARRQRPTARKVARKKRPTARMSCGKPAPKKQVIPEGMNVEYFWARELSKHEADWMREERTREEAENIEKERKRKGLEPRTEAEILEHESKIQDEPIRLLVEWMEEGEKKEKWELL